MEKKKVTAGKPLSVGGLTLIPVIETTVLEWDKPPRASFAGYRTPVAIIISEPGKKRAFRVTGEEIPFSDLVRDYPSLKNEVKE